MTKSIEELFEEADALIQDSWENIAVGCKHYRAQNDENKMAALLRAGEKIQQEKLPVLAPVK